MPHIDPARPFDILLSLHRGGQDSPLLSAAMNVAERLHARLDALCVTAMPAPAFTVPEAVSFQLEEAGERRRQAEAHADWYQRTLAARGIEGRWMVAQGDEVPTICHVAAGHDLLVLQRGELGEPAPVGFGTVSRSVFGSRVPVLVLPEQPATVTPGTRILLAWNGSREAALAARGALPLLHRADEVRVLEGVDDAAGDPMAPPQLDLDDWLARRGVQAQVQPFDPAGASGPALLEAAHAMQADLIVMGAWGRSRISEMVLGGATRHLFMESDIPMLVAH
jgi:nucleotide-binding universal stress UspA family protein